MLNLAGTLVLGRLLTPEDFGLVAIASVTLFTVMAATDTGMTAALVQLSTRRPEHYHLAWSIGLVRGTALSIILVLLAPWIAELFAAPAAVPLLQLIALKPLIDAFASPRLADLIRDFRFKTLAGIEVFAAIVELCVAVALAPKWGGKAIIVGRLVGGATIVCCSQFVAPYRPRLQLHSLAARELIAFGRWMFAIGLMAVAADLLLQVLVSRRLGVAELGMLSLATKLAWTPTHVAAEAIASAAFPLYARLHGDDQRVGAVFHAHMIGAMMLLLPITGLVVGLAGPLEHHVLGEAWKGTAPMIALLTCAFSLRLLFAAAIPLMKGMGRARELFNLEVLEYGVVITAILTLMGPMKLIDVAIAWGISSAAVSVAAAVWIQRTMRIAWRPIVHAAVSIVLVAAVTAFGAHFTAVAVGGATGAIAGASIGVVIWLLLAAVSDRWLRTDFRESAGTFFPRLAPRISRSIPRA